MTKYLVQFEGQSLIDVLKTIPFEEQNDSPEEAVKYAKAVEDECRLGELKHKILRVTIDECVIQYQPEAYGSIG